MRIFFITSKLNFETSGGSVHEFDLMMRTLQRLGHEVTAVTAFSEANKGHFDIPYKLIEENLPKRDLFGIQLGVYGLLNKYQGQADFFHVDGHNFLYGAGAYRALGGKVPVSAFFNRELGSFPEDSSALLGVVKRTTKQRLRRALRFALERTIGMWLARKIDLREFITPQYLEMYKKFGLTGSASIILGDPTDFHSIMQQNGITEETYSRRQKQDGKIRIFFSSRMAPGKGFDLLLAGFARIKEKNKYVLVLGGTGPEEGKIKQLSRDLGIFDHVQFTGWMTQERLFDEFKNADIFVQVGWRKEGASMTLLHAMAFGIPSIVPCESGLAWQAGKSALTVTNGNHDELAAAIEKLGENKALRVELSKKCYERIRDDQLDHTKVIAAWSRQMELIKETLSAKISSK